MTVRSMASWGAHADADKAVSNPARCSGAGWTVTAQVQWQDQLQDSV